jgi:ABC-type lipoprotein export system ATPase subunit
LTVIHCSHLTRQFVTRSQPVAGLIDVSLDIDRGEFVVVQGPSGCGKSTLLLSLAGMLRPDSGSITVDGLNPYSLSAAERSQFRARSIGFVFQLFHLVPYLDVRHNILAGLPSASPEAVARVEKWIRDLGLTDRQHAFPTTLSAGERQRVALARALAKQPPIILADEPTGSLDPANTAIVFHQLDAFRRAGGTVVVVTHGQEAHPFATRILQLESGRLTSSLSSTPKPLIAS